MTTRALTRTGGSVSCSPRNSKELVIVHLVEEFTGAQIRISVLRMKIEDGRKFGDAEDAQQGSLGEPSTRVANSALGNPVLPSEFDLFAPRSQGERKWQFASGHPGPFGKAWKGLRACVSNAIRER